MATILETLAIKLVLDAADFAKGMGTAESTWTQTGQKMAAVGRDMSLKVTAPLVGLAVAALKTAADYEQNMNTLQAATRATAAEMTMLSDQALDLGKKTSFSAGEASEAMLELGKAGLNVTQISGAIPGVLDLAAAGSLDLANAAEIAANAVNSFGLEATETTRIANMFAAVANASSVEVTDIADSFKMASSVFAMAGWSANDLTASIGMLGNAGIKGSDAGTSLKQMALSLLAPATAASDTMAAWGINIYDAEGKTKSFQEVMTILEDRFGAMGTKLVNLGGVTKDMAKEYEKATDKIEPLTVKISEQEAELGILQNELAATITKYGEGTTQVERKQLAITKLTNDIAANSEELSVLQTIVGVYNDALANGVPTEIAVSDAMRTRAMATIFGSDAVRAASILTSQGTAVLDEFMGVTNDTTAAQEMAEAKTKGLAGAVEYFTGTIDTLMIETASPWLDQLSQMIRGTADLLAKFSDLPAPVQRGIVVFGALLAAVGPVLVIIGSLISAVGTIAGALAGLGPIVAGAGTVLATLTGPIGIVLAAITLLAVGWNQNWFGIQELTAKAIQGIKDAFNLDWGGLGKGIVDGITNGIKNGWNAITEAASNIAHGALDAAKRALGIASPSKPGLAYGENFGSSIGMGATKAIGRIKADIYGQLDNMISGLDGQISLSGNGGGAITITVHNSFNGNVDSATVAAGSRDGLLSALRQVGLA